MRTAYRQDAIAIVLPEKLVWGISAAVVPEAEYARWQCTPKRLRGADAAELREDTEPSLPNLLSNEAYDARLVLNHLA